MPQRSLRLFYWFLDQKIDRQLLREIMWDKLRFICSGEQPNYFQIIVVLNSDPKATLNPITELNHT